MCSNPVVSSQINRLLLVESFLYFKPRVRGVLDDIRLNLLHPSTLSFWSIGDLTVKEMVWGKQK